jgi:hypothetical protein
MATKQELLTGLQFLIDEGKRIGASLDDAGWAKVQDHDGWKNKEVLAHVASVGTIVPMFAQNMISSAPGTDNGAAVDIDTLNAQLVGARAGKSVQELVDEIEAAYKGVIEFIKSQPDDVLMQKATFRGYVDVTLGDMMQRMVVLHGLSHIYSAYAATM